MLTLGIDLASRARNTAICRIRWTPKNAVVELVREKVDDDVLLEHSRAADVVGIDAPFGWPEPFVHAVVQHHDHGVWPVRWEQSSYQLTCYRKTDHFVTETTGIRPLSVSSDRIAMPAMRCAWLLSQLEVRDRSGAGRVFEVYPAAALKVWGLRTRERYKGRDGRDGLGALVHRLRAAAPWLELGREVEAALTTDHLFDALVSALNARAAGLGLTHRPADGDARSAEKEGWIALPIAGSFEKLRGTGA